MKHLRLSFFVKNAIIENDSICVYKIRRSDRLISCRKRQKGERSMGFPTFWGGVHPPQNKDLTRDKRIEPYLPKSDLAFPMSQHIGAPNAPVVATQIGRASCRERV